MSVVFEMNVPNDNRIPGPINVTTNVGLESIFRQDQSYASGGTSVRIIGQTRGLQDYKCWLPTPTHPASPIRYLIILVSLIGYNSSK